MKKIFLFFISMLLYSAICIGQQNSTAARPNASVKNLYLLGKVWGFLKYYHPTVASGKMKWDDELLKRLSTYQKIKSNNELNDSLLAWIGSLGEVPACDSCIYTGKKNARLLPDFSWFNESGFSKQLTDKLAFIRDNRHTGKQHYVQFISADGIFLPTAMQEKSNYKIIYPDSSYCLLALFRLWNYAEYWYPYKYNLPVSWDEVLKKFIPLMQAVKTETAYFKHIELLVTALHDGHGFVQSLRVGEIKGKYLLPFTLKYVQNSFIVTSILNDSLASKAGIQKGDIIESIDGKNILNIAQEQLLYTPASTIASGWNKLCYSITQVHQQRSVLSIKRNIQIFTVQTGNLPFNIFKQPDFTPAYFPFPKDSSFCRLKNGIAYLNMGRLNRNDSIAFTKLIKNARALIIDNRQNQDQQKGTGAGDLVDNLVHKSNQMSLRFSSCTPAFPGLFRLQTPTDLGLQPAPEIFSKPIVILINENTMSVGETLTMCYQQAINKKIIGTPSAGANGNVTYITLPGGITVQFTGLGLYYPDGKETQRVGIKPDIFVPQTIKGYQQNRDEQLNAAIDYLNRQIK